MPTLQDNQEIADLQRLNENLSRSLERCRELLSRCRSQLAANSNLSDAAGEGSGTRLAGTSQAGAGAGHSN